MAGGPIKTSIGVRVLVAARGKKVMRDSGGGGVSRGWTVAGRGQVGQTECGLTEK